MSTNRKYRIAGIVLAILLVVNISAWSAGSSEESEQKMIGYSNLFLGEDFFIIVRNGLAAEAEKNGFIFEEALAGRDATVMKQNIEVFATKGADIIIDFNVLPEAGSAIAGDLKQRGIPMISIDAPYDDAYFFGVNNLEAGRILGDFAVEQVEEKFGGLEWIVAMNDFQSGPEVKKRLAGVVEKASEAFGLGESQIVWLDSEADDVLTGTLTTDWLNSHPDATQVLFVGQNDDRGYAINNSVEASGRRDDVVIVSHNADPAAIENLQSNTETAWVGTASYNSHTYGKQIIEMAQDILAGKDVPSNVYTTVTIVSKENVDEYVKTRDATLAANAAD